MHISRTYQAYQVYIGYFITSDTGKRVSVAYNGNKMYHIRLPPPPNGFSPKGPMGGAWKEGRWRGEGVFDSLRQRSYEFITERGENSNTSFNSTGPLVHSANYMIRLDVGSMHNFQNTNWSPGIKRPNSKCQGLKNSIWKFSFSSKPLTIIIQ